MKCQLVCALGAVLLALPGCLSQKPASPYSVGGEEHRNPAEAARLNEQAVAILDGNPKQAEAMLRQALETDLYCAAAHNNLGTLLLDQGKLYEAAGEFEWAKKLLPGHPDPRLNLALTLEIAGRTDDAISTYKTALEVYPEHIQSMQALARIQVRSGKVDADTPRLLSEVAMRGDTEAWRDWARLQVAKAGR